MNESIILSRKTERMKVHDFDFDFIPAFFGVLLVAVLLSAQLGESVSPVCVFFG